MNIFDFLVNRFLYPFALIYISLQSFKNGIIAKFHPPVIQFENAYDGQKILLLALYQKGEIRPDLINLIEQAKRAGAYILAVNTLKLEQSEQYKNIIDCYIEKFNFGRDFGSYQTGFLHVYGNGWDQACDRLLMLNDSVYYSHNNLPQFLSDLLETECEVLGATENFEIERHLGSFCISFAGSILKKASFRKFWEKYRSSDVRPKVIRRGEMKLSRTIKRITTEFGVSALYGTTSFFEKASDDRDFLEASLEASRVSDKTAWKTVSAVSVAEKFGSLYLRSPDSLTDFKGDVTIQTDGQKSQIAFANPGDIVPGLKQLTVAKNFNPAEKVRILLLSELTEAFMQGSQIHQNATILLMMGLPIIKLDGLYRGMFEIEDLRKICEQLDTGDARSVRQLLIGRPYGGQVLRGWKRAAFMRGLV